MDGMRPDGLPGAVIGGLGRLIVGVAPGLRPDAMGESIADEEDEEKERVPGVVKGIDMNAPAGG